MPRVRLGAALLVPLPVAAEVDGLRRACGDGALGRVPPHVTLVPPVNVRLDELGNAFAVLRAAAAAVGEPFTLRLGPPATFLPDSPVLYLEVSDDDGEVGRLRDLLFQPPLARPVSWPFVPHVTLADEMDSARIEASLVALRNYGAEITVDGTHLLEQGEDRVWRPIADASFGRPVVIGRGGLPVELWRSAHPDPEAAPLLKEEFEVPAGAVPLTITARREGAILGVAVGWRRGSRTTMEEVVVTEEAGLLSVDRHLRKAFLQL